MKALCAFAFSLAAIGLFTAPAAATDANGNHEAYKWVVAGYTAVAPDGSSIFFKGIGTLQAGPGGAVTGGGTFSINGGPTGTWPATPVDAFVRYGPALPASPPPPPPPTAGRPPAP